MKKFVLFAFVALAALAASAQRANVRWLETAHDFGSFPEDGGEVSHIFRMVNDGPVPVSIVRAHATCGCTVPKYPTQSLNPGDTADIQVTFDPSGRAGRFNKQVYVETSGFPSKTRLDISGIILSSEATVTRRFPKVCGPLRLAHGSIAATEVIKGRLKTVYCDGYNYSNDSLRVEIVGKPSYLEVVASPEVAAPGEQVTLITYVNAARCPLYGFVEDSIKIIVHTTPSDPAFVGLHHGAADPNTTDSTFVIPFSMNVKEDFSGLSAERMQSAPIAVVDPQLIDLNTIPREDTTFTKTFTISNVGKDNLLIRRVYSTDPRVTISVKDTTVKKNKKTTVTLVVHSPEPVGALLNISVEVITNDPLHPISTVRLVGTYANPTSSLPD